LPRTESWAGALTRVFGDFVSIEDVVPRWLVEPGTGRRLGVDVLYPELGIALWFKGPRGQARTGSSEHGVTLADLCRRAGVCLVVIDTAAAVDSQTLLEIRAALSSTARRVAQQQGARRVKQDLLPRIASAKTTCQKIIDDLAKPRAEEPQATGTLWGWRPLGPSWRQILGEQRLATVAAVPAFLLALLKRATLFVVVLLAVNAAAYLVANFLYLRGPMAYNYVPDNQVSLAETFAPYPEYLRSVLAGDLGVMRLQEFGATEGPMFELMALALPRSLVLLGVGWVFSVVVGIAAGFMSVNYKTYQTNPLALVVSIAGFSMPGFYMAILVIYLMIWAAMRYGQDAFFLPTMGYGLDRHLILPVLALSARPTAEIARLTAELLSEELPKDYIRVARSKGLSERVVIRGHAFRNVVGAVINALSNSWAYLLGSLVIIETVFQWGGIGEALINAVTFSQYAGSRFNPALLAGLATAMALLFLLADLATGLTARALDPRLRRARTGEV
jgi:ABC-type dipeptide/oligopeptide/nickel transport system permease component